MLTALIIAGSLHGNTLLAWRPLKIAGAVSYAWYLWHWPVLWLTGTLHSGLPALPWVAVSFAIACGSTLLIEDPLRKRYRSHLRRRSRTTSTPPRTSTAAEQHVRGPRSTMSRDSAKGSSG